MALGEVCGATCASRGRRARTGRRSRRRSRAPRRAPAASRPASRLRRGARCRSRVSGTSVPMACLSSVSVRSASANTTMCATRTRRYAIAKTSASSPNACGTASETSSIAPIAPKIASRTRPSSGSIVFVEPRVSGPRPPDDGEHEQPLRDARPGRVRGHERRHLRDRERRTTRSKKSSSGADALLEPDPRARRHGLNLDACLHCPRMKTTDELREGFLSFFEERGHTRFPRGR